MNNDLISREALKEALKSNCKPEICHDYGTNWCEACCPHNDFEDLINNAPTVEPCYQTKSCLDCGNYDKENHNCPRYCEVIKEAINSRPQGKWEEPFEMNGKTYHKCNHCHISSELILIDKFCPNCGASMKGGAE